MYILYIVQVYIYSLQRQWQRLRKLTEMAQRAGLMPGKVNNINIKNNNIIQYYVIS